MVGEGGQGDEGFPILCAIQKSGALPVANHVVHGRQMGMKKRFQNSL